ncbi:DUF2147 domain-containing protein [Roseivirga pacifica]|uniref:DUF2147 domain-containing protein n=1 Tax=Roseivirga pacifica TaxID=1267423 RepID=UPI003BB0C308
MMKSAFSLFALVTVFVLGTAMQNNPDDVLGFWMTDDGGAKIEIFKEAGKYHGKIVWLKEPLNEQGKPKLDKENPDEALKTRPIIGMKLVKDFAFDDGQWEDGEIYDPKEGKTYSCRMRLKKEKLEVRGYIGAPMFGKTVVWTRTE